MRFWLPILALSFVSSAFAAHADPAYEARTATEACLAAVIDGAPVGDVQGDAVSIHRERNPNACAVTATAGDPRELHEAVMAAVAERPEGFVPARTSWDPGPLASRETLCNAPGHRFLNLVIETAKPGASPALTATVIEGRDRDRRCDLDLGPQRP